jgi:hypothetical protein
MSESEGAYTGDVTLNGDEQAPVRIENPENAYIKTGAIDGDLKVLNAEYVYTNTQAGGNVDVDKVQTKISGTIEDSYIERNAVTGDVVIVDAEDVFIEHDAVSGELQIVGEEQRFNDSSDTEPLNRGRYDEEITGWQRSLHPENPDTGISVVGCESVARVKNAEDNFELFVTGWNNEVRIDGVGNTVTIHLIGAKNTIEVSAYTNTEIATDTGHDNEITVDTFPVDDLIRQSKGEAYNNAFVGRKKITYQEPAMGEDYCPNCGATADAIIERHQEDAFFLLSYPIYHFETSTASYECEECSTDAHPEVGLSEDERKDVLQ